ncbi:MAG: VPDSG-CTERM sorting domain-containing protein [Opitutaceae bacterium]
MKTRITRFKSREFAAAAIILAMGLTSARAQYISLTPPSMPAGDAAIPSQISANGQVLVDYYNNTTGFIDGACIYNIKANTYTSLPADPDAGSYGNYQIIPEGLNGKGQVVGFELSTTHPLSGAPALYWQPYEAYVYSSSSHTFTNYVPALPGAFVGQANGINDKGQIAGVFNAGSGDQGYLLSGGTFTTIDVLPTGPIPVPVNPTDGDYPTGATTDPYDINNKGQIVGYFYDPSNPSMGQQGFEYDSGTYTTINVPGDIDTEANGINDNGLIVGGAYNPSGATYGDGFIDNGGTFTTFDYPGSVYTYINGVSDSDVFVGEYLNADGNYEGFVYVPDASSSAALLSLGLLGLLGLGFVRRRLKQS